VLGRLGWGVALHGAREELGKTAAFREGDSVVQPAEARIAQVENRKVPILRKLCRKARVRDGLDRTARLPFRLDARLEARPHLTQAVEDLLKLRGCDLEGDGGIILVRQSDGLRLGIVVQANDSHTDLLTNISRRY